MRTILLPIALFSLLSACASPTPEPVIVTRVEPLAPPQALLRVPERPSVPSPPVTNADAAEYLLRLYEWGLGLEAQIRATGKWVEEARRLRAASGQ